MRNISMRQRGAIFRKFGTLVWGIRHDSAKNAVRGGGLVERFRKAPMEKIAILMRLVVFGCLVGRFSVTRIVRVGVKPPA